MKETFLATSAPKYQRKHVKNIAELKQHVNFILIAQAPLMKTEVIVRFPGFLTMCTLCISFVVSMS